MTVECYLSPGCASEEALRANLEAALTAEGLRAEVRFLRVGEAEAARLGLRGSPSVRIDGRDVEPAEVEGFS
ncbi:MAG: hypothetical protein P8Y66_09145 [Nitrospirota bacterium]|jgi:hypothetical protein